MRHALLTVMVFEFSPAVFERFGLKRSRETSSTSAVIPLVIGGTVLSTLHQSSLGSLFLNVPDQLDKLWYSPLLPLFFFMSAVYVGPAVVIVVSTMASKALGRELAPDILSDAVEGDPLPLGHLPLREDRGAGRRARARPDVRRQPRTARSSCWRSRSASSSRWCCSPSGRSARTPAWRFVAVAHGRARPHAQPRGREHHRLGKAAATPSPTGRTRWSSASRSGSGPVSRSSSTSRRSTSLFSVITVTDPTRSRM